MRRLANVIAFDDAPFPSQWWGDVPVAGAVYAGHRLDGVLLGRVRRDGADAARRLAALVSGSRFRDHVQLIMLQGVALAGFNVVDVGWLRAELGVPVLVVARRAPDCGSIRAALLQGVPGGRRKWTLIERLGPMERAGRVWVQRAGLDAEEAEAVIARLAVHGHLPEPLRAAHLIAGALGRGESRGRV